MAFGGAHFGAGVGHIHLDDIGCYGNESNLTECSHSPIVTCHYGHLEDAGVRCHGM